MNKAKKILFKILSGRNDQNIDFTDLKYILEYFGFDLRIRGDHHIYTKNDINEIINIQPVENNKSKPYQVKQVRNIILKYKLAELENE